MTSNALGMFTRHLCIRENGAAQVASGWERDERSFREVDALPNAWLWLDAETMRAQCEAVGVDEERALSAELVSYSDTDRWEYDKGFGIVRRPAAE